MSESAKLILASFAYTLRRSSRARRLGITLYPSGDVIVTVPKRAPLFLVERFLKQKQEWIEHHRTRFEKRRERAGGLVLPKASRADYLAKKAEALKLVHEKLAHFAEIYRSSADLQHADFVYRRISIKNLRTRWGSCSRRGNLNFSYRIIYLPPELQDYLVVHELCHLGEFNHSAKFWELVAVTIPEYKKHRVKLANAGDI